MSRFEETILVVLTAVGAVTVGCGMIGTARKWWRDGIDIEFLLAATLLYCVYAIVVHVCGKDGKND